MSKMRTSNWSKQEDLILAEITLRNISEGNMMKDAWKEAEETLNRSYDASQVRWNSHLSKYYKDAIRHAKQMRENNNRSRPFFFCEKTGYVLQDKNKRPKSNFENTRLELNKLIPDSSFNKLLYLLDSSKTEYANTVKENHSLKSENNDLLIKIKELNEEIDNMNKKLESYKDMKASISEFINSNK